VKRKGLALGANEATLFSKPLGLLVRLRLRLRLVPKSLFYFGFSVI
jgi:hypothetical protein